MRNTMSKESIVWAKLPGLPPSMKWPVKVVDLPLVYSKSDNAWLRLKEIETIEEFYINDIEKWRLAAKKCLRKKPATYEAFQNDIQWAIESVEGELEGHGHPSEKDPDEINRWASNEDVVQLEEIFVDDCDEEASGEEIPTLSDETQDDRDVLNIMETNAEECIPQFRHPDEDGSHDSEEEQQTTRKKPEKSSRQKWSEGEVFELQCLFAEDFRTNTLPGQKRIEIVMKKSKENAGDIFKRKRDTIMKKLSNMMIKRRKEMLD